MATPKPSAEPLPIDTLTPREQEVIRYILDGLTIAEMGEVMGISRQTANRHIHSLYNKTGFNRRVEVARWQYGMLIDILKAELTRTQEELERVKSERDRWRESCTLGDNFVGSLKSKTPSQATAAA